MPFDPSAPFKAVEDTGFDPSKPFNPVLDSTAFDPGQTFKPVDSPSDFQDLRTFEKGPSGFTGPQTKRQRLVAERDYEATNPPTMDRMLGQLSIAPLAARGGMQKTLAGVLRAVNAPPVLSWLYSESGKQDESDAQQLSDMVGGGELGKKVQNFANTAIQSAPAMLAGPAGMGAMATVAGAQTFGQVEEDAFNAYRQQGLSADEAKSKALLPATIGGIVTAGLTRYLGGGTERLTMALMKGDLSEIAAQGMVKGILKQAAEEFPEEALDQLSQGIVERASYNPDKSWKDIVDESLEAGVSGSLLAGLTGGAAGVVSKTAQGAAGIANKIGSARTERAQTQLSSVLNELQSVRDRLAEIRQNRDTGFTRTPPSPDADQSVTAIESDGITPIDSLLSSRRQLMRRPDASFIRRAINPDTDQSRSAMESGGTTPIDTAISTSKPSRQIADHPTPVTAPQSQQAAADLTPEQIQTELTQVQSQLAAWPAITGTPQERMAQLDAKSKLSNRANFLREAIKIQSESTQPNEAQRIPEPTPENLAPKEQAQSLPANPAPVRPAETVASQVEAPAPLTPTVNTPKIEGSPHVIQVADLSVVGADDSFKAPIELLFDPGAQSGQSQASTVKGFLAINPKGKNAGQVLIQVRPGNQTTTVFTGALKDFEKSGAITRTAPEEFDVDVDKLFQSGLFTKSDRRQLAAYKLPNEVATRSVETSPDAVLSELLTIDPKVARVIAPLISRGVATIDFLKNLAISNKGGATYSKNDPKQLAQQVASGIRSFLNASMRAYSNEEGALQARAISQWLDSPEANTAQSGEIAADAFMSLPGFSRLEKSKEERSQLVQSESDLASEDSETGEAREVFDKEGTWDDARVDGILGLIEDKNPKLYQSFSAEATNDKAWDKIEQELIPFLNGDKVAAEMLAESIRQRRAEGWVASPSEFPELEAEHRWQTGINAKGKQQILDVLNNRQIPFDPELRRIGLALVERLPEKYLSDLTFNVAEDGSIAGEFIPWLKVARVATNATNPQVAAEEISHYLANFLTDSERQQISAMRRSELDRAKTSGSGASKIANWIDLNGGSVTSQQFISGEDRPLLMANEGSANDSYRLINDDEYFAHYLSQAAAKAPEQITGVIAKAKDIFRRIITALKAWAGNRDAYFDQLLSKFERGEFDVSAQGGMLWEQNNGNSPKSLKPISSLTELNKYRTVDQGVEEQRQVNTLTVEQNEPIVGGDVEEKFSSLPRPVRNELPWIAGRLAAMKTAVRNGISQTTTPLKNYARVVNWLNLKSEAKTLQDSIEADLQKLTKLHENQPKVTQAQAKANAMGEIVGDLISGYKDYLLSEQRKNQNAGLATGLAEAVKSLDQMQKSTTALERAVQYLSESVSLQDLMSPDMSVGDLVNLLKRRIETDSNVSDWQAGRIPSSEGRPGVSNDQLRIAIRLMQQRQGLVQDILTYKQLSDPDSLKSIIANENDFDREIAALNRNQLPSFLKGYYEARTAKDKARQIYLKHRRQMGSLIDAINNKVAANDWLNVNVLNSDRLKTAMSESSAAGGNRAGFMSADLIDDGVGGSALKRTYYNPINREESITIVDGTTRKDFEQNIDKFEKVQEWYQQANEDPNLDPLDREMILLEYHRIEQEELNDAFNPEIGKRYPGRFNAPNMVADLRGNTLQFAMEKIGGRAAVKAVLAGQIMSEGKRLVANARHDGQYKMQQLNLEAARAQGIGNTRWLTEVADPILASYNSLGAKQMAVGDVTRYGHTVKATDLKAVREMKAFIDSISDGVKEIKNPTAKTHPILTREIIAGRPIYRVEQGHSKLVVPRRIRPSFDKLIKQWEAIKSGRNLKESTPALAQFLSEGEPFRELVLSHIYSTQKYPDYVGKTRFGKAYRELYQNISSINNLDEVVDKVFDEQAGDDVANQMSKDDIRREIVTEVDSIARRMGEDERTRASESTSSTASIESGDNFLTKPRGEMIAPDSAYKYGVFGNDDVRWLVNSALEVLAQRTRNALEKVETELREYISEFSDRAKHPDPQSETKANQIAGNDWLNYREAKQMLLQVRKILDTLTPGGVSMMSNEMLTGIGNKFYSVLIQNLLQSMPVMARNVLGYNLRRTQFEAELSGDKLWYGVPRWLMRLPGETLAGRGLVYPIRNTAKSIREGLAYRKAIKAGITEDTLRDIASNARTMESAGNAVKASVLRHAVNAQKFRDLGAGERYGIKQQIERYIQQFYYGGDVEVLDPNTKEKVAGAIKSVMGLIEETGGGVMLPKFVAPRKLEMFLNADAMKVAQQFSDELELHIREAVRDRQQNNRMDSPITDSELLGVHSASKGDAYYMRNILTRAGLNIGALTRRLAQNWEQPLLTQAEFGVLAQEVAKETNMSSDDNRPRYKTGFGRMMGALTGYAFWYGERQAMASAPSSRSKGVDPKAIYRAMMFTGLIVAMGLAGTPLIRLLKEALWGEEDMTGHFSSGNTAWRNAAVLWEQSSYYWPIIGSIMSQLYDARTGSKSLNVVPIGMANSFLRAINETAQTGNAFYPLVNLLKSISPNTRVALNRLPQTEGLVEVNNANRILRETADGTVEVRKPSPGKVNYSPATTQIQMAVNELAKSNPDWNALEAYRKSGIQEYVKSGASAADAAERFDKSVLVRFPMNTVYGRPLTQGERDSQFSRMSASQIDTIKRVESAFGNYAERFGIRKPGTVQKPRKPKSSGGRSRSIRSRIRPRRNSSLLRKRNRGLTRGA